MRSRKTTDDKLARIVESMRDWLRGSGFYGIDISVTVDYDIRVNTFQNGEFMYGEMIGDDEFPGDDEI